jgi:DnaJ-class molecular chaperone
VPAYCKPATRLSIPQKGIQYGNSEWKKGDHVVVLQMRIPKAVDDETKQLFKEIGRELN